MIYLKHAKRRIEQFMTTNRKKQFVIVTVLFIVVSSVIAYSILKKFNIYDFSYLIFLIVFYIRYIKLKLENRNYIDL